MGEGLRSSRGGRRCSCALVGAVGGLLIAASGAQAAWTQPVGGASPINFAANQNAGEPSLTVIGGVPYVAYKEADGTQDDIRVSRLNAAGTAWEQVVGGANPINLNDAQDGGEPTLISIGGVPHLSWTESDGMSAKLRVSRLNAAGTDWVEIVPGVNPINNDPARGALHTTLTAIGGVPWVAWDEFDGIDNSEVRVSRLNAAGTAWVQPVGGTNPINLANNRNGANPSLVSFGGVPYVAWAEDDGTNRELRVSRLNDAGNDWVEVVGGASPINEASSAGRNAADASLSVIDGALYVAWTELDGVNTEVRVSRLNDAGNDWVQVVGGPSPINHANNQNALGPTVTSIDDVPYVSWLENDGTGVPKTRVSRLNHAGTAWEEIVGGPSPINLAGSVAPASSSNPSLAVVGTTPYVAWTDADGTNDELRVSRLEPEFSAPAVIPGETDAVLISRVTTFGVPASIAFDFGPGSSLASRTAPVDASGQSGSDTVAQTVTGLASATEHSFRPVGVDGTYAFTPGATTTFRTGPFPITPDPEPVITPTPPTPPTPLLVAITNSGRLVTQGRRVAIDFVATTAGAAAVEISKGKGPVTQVVGTAVAGDNRLTWNGRTGSKPARPGRYTVKLTVTSDDGQAAQDSGTVVIKRKRKRG